MQVSELQPSSDLDHLSTEQACYQWLSDWLGKSIEGPLDLVDLEESGVSTQSVDRLVKEGLDRRDLAWIVPLRTLAHRKQRGETLDRGESSRLIRFLSLLALAEVVFANRAKAYSWLYRPLQRFGGRRPLDLVQTEQGAELAQEALWQLDEGLFA